jgi:polyphosphate kinase
VKFLAIFNSNLDEFFMKRVGGMHRQRADKLTERSLDGMTVEEQLSAVHARVRPMLKAQIDLWFTDLHPALKRERIQIKRYADLTADQKKHADAFFAQQVFTVLTPLAVDPGHPFPFISNLSKSMGVMLAHPSPRTGQNPTSFVRIKIPENLPRWLNVPDKDTLTFVPLESVIGGNLALLFPGMNVLEHHLFRVTSRRMKRTPTTSWR